MGWGVAQGLKEKMERDELQHVFKYTVRPSEGKYLDFDELEDDIETYLKDVDSEYSIEYSFRDVDDLLDAQGFKFLGATEVPAERASIYLESPDPDVGDELLEMLEEDDDYQIDKYVDAEPGSTGF